MITHKHLLKLAHALGYEAMGMKGLCRGFSAMYAQANCCGELDRFKQRLHLLENYNELTISAAVSTVLKKAKTLSEQRKSSYAAASTQEQAEYIDQYLDRWFKKINPAILSEREAMLFEQRKLQQSVYGLLSDEEQTRYTNAAFNEEAYQSLSPQEQALYEVRPFFEGIALYLYPEKFGGKELFGKSLVQSNLVEIGSLLRPLILEDKDDEIHRGLKRRHQFNLKKLQTYLEAINKKLNCRDDVSIILAANNHSVHLRVVGDDQFEFVDTNHLELMSKCYTSSQLAKILHIALGNNKGDKPVIFLSEIYHAKTKPIMLSDLPAENITTVFKDKHGNTIVHISALENGVDTLKRVQFGSHININQLNKKGQTAFGVAINSRQYEVANYLLEYPALNVNALINGLTPLSIATSREDIELMSKIIAHSSFDPKQTDKQGTALHIIAKYITTDDCIPLAQTLIKQGIKLDKKDKQGITPLMMCCMAKNEPLLKLLLQHGARVDVATKGGNTALHYAIGNQFSALAKPLILGSKKLDHKNKKGYTALTLAYKTKNSELIPLLLEKTPLTKDDFKSNVLLEAVKENDDETIREFTQHALKCYVMDRAKRGNYYGFFNTGFSKTQKMSAAEALLGVMQGQKIDLKPHFKALTNGRLYNLYRLYVVSKAYPPEPESESSLRMDVQ